LLKALQPSVEVDCSPGARRWLAEKLTGLAFARQLPPLTGQLWQSDEFW
jgi:hypothetical protein